MMIEVKIYHPTLVFNFYRITFSDSVIRIDRYEEGNIETRHITEPELYELVDEIFYTSNQQPYFKADDQ